MKALIVDDEPGVLRVLSVLLELHGWQCETALSLREAREALCSPQRFDLAMIDLTLADGLGTELIDEARRVRPHQTHLVLMSALEEPEGHAADTFLSKPFDLDDVEGLMEACRRRREGMAD